MSLRAWRIKMNKIGQQIKLYRKKKGYTLEGLSERCGLSTSYLSLLERGKNNPTILTIQEICAALDISISDLFNDIEKNRFIIRKDERELIFSEKDTVKYYSLSDRAWPVQLITIEVSDSIEHTSHKHDFSEIGLVLEGKMKITIDGETTEISKGDSLYIMKGSEHSFYNIGDVPCISLWIQVRKPEEK